MKSPASGVSLYVLEFIAFINLPQLSSCPNKNVTKPKGGLFYHADDVGNICLHVMIKATNSSHLTEESRVASFPGSLKN